MIAIALFGLGIVLGMVLGKAHERELWMTRILGNPKARVPEPERPTEAIARVRGSSNPDLTVLEAVDAIAVEVERLGEGQRFLTKLLAERDARLSGRAVSPIPGSVRSQGPPSV